MSGVAAALAEAAEARRQLEQTVRDAIKAIGHDPDERTLTRLPDDTLAYLADYYSPGAWSVV